MSLEKKLKTEKRFTELLKICEKACFIMAKFVQDVYAKLNKDKKMMKEKADNSFFTIGDGLVQYMVMQLLPLTKFKELCGEESNVVNVSKRPYTVDELKLTDEIADSFDTAMKGISELIPTISKGVYNDVGIFVDPIDGTKEFCTGHGEQCSICIGFAQDAHPVAGIVFRPIPAAEGKSLTYMAACKEEGYSHGVLDKGNSGVNNILTSRGSISKYIEALLKELSFEQEKHGGAGNKVMLLLEGKGGCYIQDRGVSRWDTCAAQAILEAHGGALVKLSGVIDNNRFEHYKYKVGDTNLDLYKGAELTKYNVRRKEFLSKKPWPKADAETLAPYSNVCGLFATKNANADYRKKLMDACRKVAGGLKPSFC